MRLVSAFCLCQVVIASGSVDTVEKLKADLRKTEDKFQASLIKYGMLVDDCNEFKEGANRMIMKANRKLSVCQERTAFLEAKLRAVFEAERQRQENLYRDVNRRAGFGERSGDVSGPSVKKQRGKRSIPKTAPASRSTKRVPMEPVATSSTYKEPRSESRKQKSVKHGSPRKLETNMLSPFKYGGKSKSSCSQGGHPVGPTSGSGSFTIPSLAPGPNVDHETRSG